MIWNASDDILHNVQFALRGTDLCCLSSSRMKCSCGSLNKDRTRTTKTSDIDMFTAGSQFNLKVLQCLFLRNTYFQIIIQKWTKPFIPISFLQTSMNETRGWNTESKASKCTCLTPELFRITWIILCNLWISPCGAVFLQLWSSEHTRGSRRTRRTGCVHRAEVLVCIWSREKPRRCHNRLKRKTNRQSRWVSSFCFWGGERSHKQAKQNHLLRWLRWFPQVSTSSWLLPLLSISWTYGSWNMTKDGTLCNPYKEQIIVGD